MTDDAWFGVTPEPVALRIATDLPRSTASPSCRPSTGKKRKRAGGLDDGAAADPETPATRGPRTLIDLFGGAGGNTIAFANSGHFDHVIAVERDAATLACAQHNASVYRVPPGVVTWVLGDCFEFLAALKQAHGLGPARDDAARHRAAGDSPHTVQRAPGDDGASGPYRLQSLLRSVHPASTTLFASPPWGGVGYSSHDVFDLGTMQPYNLAALSRACQPFGHALYLPRTSDLRQVAELVGSDPVDKVEVVQYCMEGASKALVAYVPPKWDAKTEGRRRDVCPG
ncbi:hypothetical protein P8C59_000302 [Phyllachora maydis]|uniref:Trimethylguanosine synthase n=1 Tax=Phyllachora maydis TaxID=1825666 RepID=A0AAD9HVN7_9PEZI|nr:hypothetical protein P8C59_000302 [Phyllachora maydis]